MRFKYKVLTQTGDTKTDTMTANSEPELKKLLGMMGQELIEVLEREKPPSLVDGLSPEQQAKLMAASAGGVPNMGSVTTGAIPETPIAQAQATAPKKYKEYTDNGVLYRVELNSGKLQKKSWVKLSRDELKEVAIEDGGELKTAHAKKLTLYKLEWMDLG